MVSSFFFLSYRYPCRIHNKYNNRHRYLFILFIYLNILYFSHYPYHLCYCHPKIFFFSSNDIAIFFLSYRFFFDSLLFIAFLWFLPLLARHMKLFPRADVSIPHLLFSVFFFFFFFLSFLFLPVCLITLS